MGASACRRYHLLEWSKCGRLISLIPNVGCGYWYQCARRHDESRLVELLFVAYDDGNRLRSCLGKVSIAEATHIKTRRQAPIGGFHV